MTRGECVRTWQIDALREGRLGSQDAESFERHRRLCATCAASAIADAKLGELARALPNGRPTELELRRVRARVMHDTAMTEVLEKKSIVSRAAAGALAFIVLSVVAGFLAIHSAAQVRRIASTAAPVPSAAAWAPEEPFAGSVAPSSDARWTQTRVERIERVHLDVGTLTVHVRPQRSGERFLVELPDGDLEVRGTIFTLSVRGGATTGIRVAEGTVELRLAGQPARALVANDVWPAPAPDVPRPSRRASLPTTGIGPSSHAYPGSAVGAEQGRVASYLVDDGPVRYANAIGLLRAGKYDEAASAFHEFDAARPRAAQAEDASFLEAVALARSGRLDAAALVAEHHLESFPQSFHRKDAAILVARAASARDDCDKARAVLLPWLDAIPEAGVRAVLRACVR